MTTKITLPPPQLEQSWKEILKEEWAMPYVQDLVQFLVKEREEHPVYPPSKLVFNAFQYTPYDKVNVVIMGQDPYHGQGQAHGLSFSVAAGVPPPPSLKNIFKEIQSDLGLSLSPSNGCLLPWAKQGVLLLNAVLTVREGKPGSHQGKGWELFTHRVVEKLCERKDPVIFVLWGKSAQEKCKQILQQTDSRHHVLTASHPSPLSAHGGFFGCRHFSKINELLVCQGKSPINWQL